MSNRKIEQVVAKQIEFQETMSSNSKTMYLALVEELGECVASMGYADWKVSVRDVTNIEIEMVDIAVFAINLEYYSKYYYTKTTKFSIFSEFDLIKKIIKALAEEKYSDIYYMIFNYHPHLIDVLTAKQALNQLRQDYGYKKGEYIKDWHGEEDNTYLKDYYGSSYDTVYAEMEQIYVTKIVGESLVNTWEK